MRTSSDNHDVASVPDDAKACRARSDDIASRGQIGVPGEQLACRS